MKKKAWLPIKIILTLLVFLASPRTASAYYTNMPASVVIGQPDFVSNSANQGGSTSANTISSPSGTWSSNGKNLIVADGMNNRVLIYNKIPESNNPSADIVIGQPDFTSSTANQGGSTAANTLSFPRGICSNGTNLVVADYFNNRVLIFNSIPTINNATADIVIGQPDMSSNTANNGGISASTLRGPRGVFCTNEKIIISDTANKRVLIYNTIPQSNGAAADVVVGQDDFVSVEAIPANGNYHNVSDTWIYDNKLFVADQSYGRVLIYDPVPTANGTRPRVVIGWPDLSATSDAGLGNPSTNTLYSPRGLAVANGKIFIGEFSNHRLVIFNQIPTTNNVSADIVIGQSDFTSNFANQGGNAAANTLYGPSNGLYATSNKLFVVDGNNHRILIFEDYEATATPGFTMNYPPEGSGEKMRLSGNIVMGEYGKFDLRSPEVSINNQGFGPLTNFSKRQHSDHETITEFYHEFEPWAGIAPRDQWTEGDGFTAHFRTTSYQSRIETQEAFLFWPFTLDSINTDSAVPVFSFHIPSKNVDYIKSNLDRFEVYIGIEGSFSKYLKRVPVSFVGEDGRVIVSADSDGVQTAEATFLPGEYEVKVRAFDKWGNHFDSNAVPLTLTQTLVSVESTPLFSGFWFPLQINRATGINTGILSSFRPENVLGSYSTSTLKPMFTGIAFVDSLITMTVVNNQNPGEVKTFTATTGPDSTWSLSPTLYPDSTVSISAQKAGLSAQIQPFPVRLLNAQ